MVFNSMVDTGIGNMDVAEYQSKAREVAIYPRVGGVKEGDPTPLYYLGLGLAGESGEISEKLKKLLRDRGGIIDEEFRQALLGELGDVIWYISNLCSELDVPLGDVMQTNIDKLHSRKDRGKLHGDGDNR